jgi:hypothetical protein
MAYCATSDVKAAHGVKDSDTTEDTVLGWFIPQAQQFIDTYTGRKFESTTDYPSSAIRYFDAAADVDGLVLYLDEDLASITTITNGDGTTVSSSDYVTEPRNEKPYDAIRLLASPGISWTYTTDAESSIAIDGEWCYSTDAPEDIMRACARLALWYYKQRNTDIDLDRPLLTGDGLTIMPARVPRDVKVILDLYRKVRLARYPGA